MSTPPTVEQLMAAKEIVITCGSGGVGKTSVAAALGTMAAIHLGGRVLVLTVDPARRLATALGLEALGNVETQIAPEMLRATGREPRGELWVAMLDTKQSWDDLVLRHAKDEETAYRILENRLYHNLTARFVQSHDYIAMERLYEIHSSGRYDLVVVDTPPTRNALDFLDAPARMAEFFSSRLLRWLTVPYRSRLVTVASRPFYTVADRVLGTKFLEEIAEFFSLFQTMERGFVTRAKEVSRVLADRRTTFMVITTLEASPLHEAEFFMDALRARKLPLGGLVLNKVLPSYLLDPDVARAAEALRDAATVQAVAAELGPAIDAPVGRVGGVLTEVASSFANFQVVAKREAEQRAELARVPEVTAAVPYLDEDIHDLIGLTRLGGRLWR